MGRKLPLTVRISAATTTTDAMALLRERAPEDSLLVEAGTDGHLTVRGAPGSPIVTSAHLTGRITLDGRGLLLDAEVHKSSNGLIWPWLMGIPAVFLLVCSTASLLFDGFSPGPAIIGIPGAAALALLLRMMLKQNEEHFRQDVNTYRTTLHDLLNDPDDLDDDPDDLTDDLDED